MEAALPKERKETYLDRFRRLEPISSLSDEQIQELAEQSTIEKVASDTVLFDDRSKSSSAIYLLDGAIEAQINGSDEKRTVIGGSADAVYPVTSEKNHFNSAVTSAPSVITRIDKELLDTLLTWAQITAPETEVLMSEDGIISIDKADWLKTMFKSPTFRSLPAANIEALLSRLEPLRVHAGDVIIRQGDPGDYFYMIDQGTAMVTRNPDDDEDSVEMAELAEGYTFGEAALISDKPRNATVSMMSDGILLRLSKDDFIKLLKQPSLLKVSFKNAQEKIGQQKAQWIDVRLSSEFEHAHLPGAVNIQMREMHRSARDLDKNILYVCYCETGSRSSAATFVLAQYGFQAAVLEGGLRGDAGAALTEE